MLISKEFEFVERKVSAWLISNDGQQRGKIIARHTKKAAIGLPIEGCEVMTG